jgi:hypothetical protein
MDMADMHEGELEMELEDEFREGELEEEAATEGEGWLGTIGNIASSLLGESELEEEGELEEELEAEGEGELEGEEEGEGEFGAIGNIVGSLLGESEEELEGEEETEEFFGKIGGFLKKAAPILKSVAKVAAPLVGTAIAGPAGGMLGKLASSALGEEELEGEFEEEGELEEESEQEVAHEIASHELTHNEAISEMMAEAASQAAHEGEAEAMVGAATVTVLSPRDRRALRRLLKHLVRGSAVLTRILRRRRATRLAVRAVPAIMRRTVRQLKRQAAKGIPITRRRVARAAARQVRKVLASPRACATAVKRNVRVSRAYRRPRLRFRRRRQALVR